MGVAPPMSNKLFQKFWQPIVYFRCTNSQWYGCSRTGTPQNLLNPIKSARIRSLYSFSFKYGKVEVRAKLPSGDWLWPGICNFQKIFDYYFIL